MTTYYCGIGGNDANAGTSWALRRLTLNASEDLLTAGDTLYIGPGTYKELWTIDQSGTAGNIITAIGDYTGANTDGVGGMVRITGAAANEQTASRASAITATSKSYRTFRGFTMDVTSSTVIPLTSCDHFTIDECAIYGGNVIGISTAGASQGTTAITNCYFSLCTYPVFLSHTSAVDNAGHTVDSCVFQANGGAGVASTRVGGVTVRNCAFLGGLRGVQVITALTVGQIVTVNNCVFIGIGNGFALTGTVTGEIIENYNALYGNSGSRSNVATGANSVTYPFSLDSRWFHEITNGGRLVTPFDMASYCALVNVAGTSPPSADLRGTAAIGGTREWAALEYDSTLLVEGGGGVTMWPLSNGFIQAIIGGGV